MTEGEEGLHNQKLDVQGDEGVCVLVYFELLYFLLFAWLVELLPAI
jgi:hypothetical protein